MITFNGGRGIAIVHTVACMMIRKLVQAVAVCGVLALALAACGGSDDGSGSGSGSGGGLRDAPVENAQDSDRPAACDLLTEDEVTDVIGPHDGGAHDYVFGGCVWTASSGEDGFTPSIHVAVLTADEHEALAEPGEPVAGFGDGATYADLHGELWFPCQGDKFCGVKAGTADGDTRQGAAEQLAKAVQERV